jgi:hypothetical protein
MGDGNLKSGKTLAARGLPPRLLDLLEAGGIYAMPEKTGIIEPLQSVN